MDIPLVLDIRLVLQTTVKEYIIGFALPDNSFGLLVKYSTTTFGDHPTLELLIGNNTDINKLPLIEYNPLIPAVCIPKWESGVRQYLLVSVKNTPVYATNEINYTVKVFRSN